MGEAIVAALTHDGLADVTDICVADVTAARLMDLEQRYGVNVTPSNSEAAHDADYVMLAVKPQDFDKVAADLKGAVDGAGAVVSIMAGVTLARLTGGLGTQALVRAMPNTPAQIGAGMTAWTATEAVAPAARDDVRKIFAALGEEAYVPEERYLDMATALSGCGPGYVFLFIEALIDAGVQVGLTREMASKMALQTVLGSARYAIETGRHPAELRDLVTSPAGTTAAGLRALEAGGLRAAITEAVVAAFNRSRELGQGSGT
jgi:pyrroline-5-carboxylate reductase